MQLIKGNGNGYDMRVTERRTEAERLRDYRQRMGPTYRTRDAARKRKARAVSVPSFIGVDGEGTGRGKNHKYVLLSVGDQSITDTSGIRWEKAFQFLYEQFEKHPRSAFVGFYLSYDFNQILKTLPVNVAFMLLSKDGRAMRKKPENRGQRSGYYPVRHDGWEFDMLGFKRLSIRPIADGCQCGQKLIKCPLKRHLPYMHICDAGAFYQMSFLKVLQKFLEQDETLCTQAEFDKIVKGKNRRSTARLDDEMIEYNVLENELLSRVMARLAEGFVKVGIRLAKDQWYGPGAPAAKWLAKHGALKRSQLVGKGGLIPKWFWIACRRSYFGGWFEIFSHGIIKGESYNYDINNAYPYATTKLPHLCDACKFKRGQGTYTGSGAYVLMYCTVFSGSTRCGPLPHRDKQGSILRPTVTKGWYWRAEIEASRRAGLVKKVMENEWMEFIPCNHPKPFTDIQVLYDLRLSVGKDSAQGWAIKLNNNSIYGKFAQDVGAAPFNNWLYASLITSHCRIQILDAIAAHPGGTDSVLMVATDGICFDSPHPTLPISKQLGEWGTSTYEELVLFKPGVYWHKEGKEKLLKVKSRGVPRDEFAKAINEVEDWFRHMDETWTYPGMLLEEWNLDESLWPSMLGKRLIWPRFQVPINFRMKSCKQALQEGKWETAGEIQESIMVTQDSDPSSKRGKVHGIRGKNRIDTIIRELPIKEIETHYHKEIAKPPIVLPMVGLDGNAESVLVEAFATLRAKDANYDLPLGDIEWVQVW